MNELKPCLSFHDPVRPDYLSDKEWRIFCMGFNQGLLEGSRAGRELAGEILALHVNPAPIIVDTELWNRRAGGEKMAELKLPEDVRSFIYRVTLHLQANRSKTPNQHDSMFQESYKIYDKYDVENRRAKEADHGKH